MNAQAYPTKTFARPQTTVYPSKLLVAMSDAQKQRLQEAAERANVPLAQLAREGIDMRLDALDEEANPQN